MAATARGSGESGLFRSYWLGGFEGACHVNRAGRRIDMIAMTQHDRHAEADYALLREVGIRAARDGIRWPLVERDGGYDFSSFAPMLDAAERQGTQIIWTLCHYGVPDGLDILSPAFVARFAGYCAAVAEFVAARSAEVPLYTPINEISFLSWAADVGYIFPEHRGGGREVKRQLVRAAIAGIEALRAADPRARIVHVDPLVHVLPPRHRPDLAGLAAAQRAGQFEAWDMLAGRREPELGGHPRYLDVIGLNFYHANQWEYPGADEAARLRWEDVPRDERWVPLHLLLAEVHERYGRPLFLAETSHFGEGRGAWIREIAEEVRLGLAAGTPIEGICIYPILDRPDWDDADHWHQSGLWELVADERGDLRRVVNSSYLADLQSAQSLLGPNFVAA